MKKTSILLASMLAVSLMSCNKEMNPAAPGNSDDSILVEKSFIASYEEETRVSAGSIVDGKLNLLWNEGDKVYILAESQELPSSASDAENLNGNSASFKAWTPAEATAYYAVYPASAVATTDTWVPATNEKQAALRVIVPSEQQAVHNSFDPKAYVATAVTTDNHLTFKPIVSALKFQLGTDAPKVEKVVFKINGATNVAGTAVLYIDNFTTHTWLSGKSEAFDKVTLTKPADGFRSETDYYIIFRSNACDNGITLDFCLNDGTVKTISSSTKLFSSTVKGAVKSFGDILSIAKSRSPKEAYELGYDIVVGDKTLNLVSNGAANYVQNSEVSEVALNLKSGVNFIEGKFKMEANKAIEADTYIIANGEASLNLNAKNFFHKAGTFGFKDVTLDASSNTNYIVSNTNATANSDLFILDACKIKAPKPVYYINNTSYTCKNLLVVDTDVELTAGCNVFDFSQCTSSGLAKVEVNNSIFYASTNSVSKVLNFSSAETVSFTNNTVFNLHAGTDNGLIHASGSITSFNLQNNLFNFYGLSSSSEYIVNATHSASGIGNNFFYKRNSDDTNSMFLYGSTTLTWEGSAITTNDYPYTSNKPGAGAVR